MRLVKYLTLLTCLYALIGCQANKRFPGETLVEYLHPLSLRAYNSIEIKPLQSDPSIDPLVQKLCQKTIMNAIISGDFFKVINGSPRYSTYMPSEQQVVILKSTLMKYEVGNEAPIGEGMTTALLTIQLEFLDKQNLSRSLGSMVFNIEANQPIVGIALERFKIALEDNLKMAIYGNI